jgi:hypothetical protein
MSGIGNITGTKYLENYNLYKQTLIEGLATKPHFSELFVTWNREVFPRSQATKVIPDSQPGAFIGGERNESSDIGVTNILQQLSLEENDSSEDEEAGDRSDPPHSNYNSDQDDDFYVSDPPHPQSVPSDSTQVTTIATITTTDLQANPNPDTVDGLQYRQGSKASKKAPVTPVKTVRRSSARNAKGSVATNVEPSLPSPIQPINATSTEPPPQAKRATRGSAKGKARK